MTKCVKGEVQLSSDHGSFTDWCDVLVNGAGVVNKWKCEASFPETALVGPSPS